MAIKETTADSGNEGGEQENTRGLYRRTEIVTGAPTRCVDGRKNNTEELGAQMLGGSLNVVVLRAIDGKRDIDVSLVTSTMEGLVDAGFTPGVHRGSHKHLEEEAEDLGKSDCGLADRLKDIIAKAQGSAAEIKSRMMDLYKNEEYKNILDGLEKPFEEIINEAIEKIQAFDVSKIKITGEKLIRTAVAAGAKETEVEGEHEECQAFVNLEEGVTHDTNAAAAANDQGFGLDMFPIVKEAQVFGIDASTSVGITLVLFQATEMVLVEDKGKEQLPVRLHA